ncbi:MAG: phosphatidylglycerophosphatase A [bacterium]|nr:phosphatidylglycerophosphatase A [bacterium]
MTGRINTFLGSVAWTGFFPIAPATFTTLALAGMFWLWAPGPLALALTMLVSLVVSVPVSFGMERDFGKDPSECTIDEFVGYIIALQGRDLSAPGSWKILLVAFFLFRFYDILKIWPGNRFEEFRGGWGIVADDAMAGVYSFITLWLIVRFLPWLF